MITPIGIGLKRNDLPKIFFELDFQVGAEIGVERGLFSEVLCQENPGVELFCIDPWVAHPLCDDPNLMESYYEEAKKRLSSYDCKLIRDYSEEAVKRFSEESLDFIYIDGDHSYQGVTHDLNEWTKIVKKGGIVSGHDYGHWKDPNKNLESKRAIDEYVKANHKLLFLVNKNRQTSWFFIK
jgi:hypothetical protein